MKEGKIYIAYHDQDLAIAKEIYKELKAANKQVALREYFVGGDKMKERISEEIKSAQFSIIIISSAFDQKTETSYFGIEYRLIVERSESLNGKNFIIPITVGKGIDLKGELLEIIPINYYPQEGEEKKWIVELFSSIARGTNSTDHSDKRKKDIMNDTEQAYKYLMLNDRPKEVEPSYYYAAGLYAFHKKNYELALSFLLHAKANNLLDSELFSKIGACYIKLNKFDDAIWALGDGVKFDKPKKHVRTFYNLGMAYTRKGEMEDSDAYLNQAIGYYEIAIEQRDENYQAVNNLAINLKRKGLFVEGIQHLENYIERNKIKNEYICYNLACLQARNKDFAAAFKNLANAIRFTPELLNSAVFDSDLDNLKSNKNGNEFWHLIWEVKKDLDSGNLKGTQTISGVGKYVQTEIESSRHAEKYFNLACLCATDPDSIEKVFNCLKIALLLESSLVDRIIKSEDLGVIKKGEHSKAFWALLCS